MQEKRAMPTTPENLAQQIEAARGEAARLGSALEALERRLATWTADATPRGDDEELTLQWLLRRLGWLRRMNRAIRDLEAAAAASSLREVAELLPGEAARNWRAPSGEPAVLYSSILAEPEAESEDLLAGLEVFVSYIDTSDTEIAVRYMSALRRVLDAAQYELVIEAVDEWGSWVKRLVVRARNSGAPKRLAEGVAQATQDAYVRGPGAEATLALAQAVRVSLDAMGDNEGCQLYDNLIVGKRRTDTGDLVAFSKELTVAERRALRSRPLLLEKPREILEALQEIVELPLALTAGDDEHD